MGPGMGGDAGLSPVARTVVVLAALAIVIGFLKLSADFITPILLALFIAIVATPPLRWMRRRGLPMWIGLAIVGFLLLDIGSIIALVTTGALEGFRNGLPTYQERLVLLNEQFGIWMESVGMAESREAAPDFSIRRSSARSCAQCWPMSVASSRAVC